MTEMCILGGTGLRRPLYALSKVPLFRPSVTPQPNRHPLHGGSSREDPQHNVEGKQLKINEIRFFRIPPICGLTKVPFLPKLEPPTTDKTQLLRSPNRFGRA